MAKKKDVKDGFIMVDGIVCTTAAPLMDIDKIIPYENNPKVHGSELEVLKNAIRNPEIGFCDPIEVDRDMVIVSGHGRRLAALELGMTKVPVCVHEHMHGEASDAYRLIANRTSDLSGYDWDVMTIELGKLEDSGWDMEQFSFEPPRDLGADAEFEGGDSDFVIEPESETETVTDTAAKPYKLMVYFDSPAVQGELFERLVSEGYDCQMLDREGLGGVGGLPRPPPKRTGKRHVLDTS